MTSSTPKATPNTPAVDPLRFRMAAWIMKHRGPVLIAFILITLGFMGGFPGIEIRTIFKDLLPGANLTASLSRSVTDLGNLARG